MSQSNMNLQENIENVRCERFVGSMRRYSHIWPKLYLVNVKTSAARIGPAGSSVLLCFTYYIRLRIWNSIGCGCSVARIGLFLYFVKTNFSTGSSFRARPSLISLFVQGCLSRSGLLANYALRALSFMRRERRSLWSRMPVDSPCAESVVLCALRALFFVVVGWAGGFKPLPCSSHCFMRAAGKPRAQRCSLCAESVVTSLCALRALFFVVVGCAGGFKPLPCSLCAWSVVPCGRGGGGVGGGGAAAVAVA